MNILLIPCSVGGLAKAKGAELAPEAVVKHLKENYLNESGVAPKFDVKKVAINPSNIEESFNNIADAISKEQGKFIALGGDHSITHPILKAMAKKYPGIGIISFDAHPDMMQPFSMPTHENFLRTLIEDGIVPADKVIVVGVRNADIEEMNFARQNDVKLYPMKIIALEGKESVCDGIMEVAKDWPALYLSIDIDVLDPAFAPGTGYAEPAGLTSRELLYFIQRILLLKNVKAMDLVEINPAKDVQEMTSKLGAKILGEMAK